MPDFRTYEQPVPAPGAVEAQDMTVLGAFVRDIMRENMGGFEQYSPYDTELYTRWVQFGMFSPIAMVFGICLLYTSRCV